jgi:hypothetical protein
VYLSMGERDRETSGISAPVFRVAQELVGALGIVGPSARMGMEEMERYRPRLLEFAARVTKALGGDAEPLLAAASVDAPTVQQKREHRQSNDGRADASGQTQENENA